MKRKNLLGVLLSAVLSISAMGVIPHMVYADTNSDMGNDYTGYAGGYIAGNLDNNNAWEIMNLLEMINSRGTTVVVVTHNMEIVRAMGKRVIAIQKGTVVSDSLTDSVGGDDYEN